MTAGKKTVVWILALAIFAGMGYMGIKNWLLPRIMMKMMTVMMAKGGGPMGMPRMGGPMPTPVSGCVIEDVTDSYDFTGTTEAVNHVEIRARVEGYLKGVHFTDGSIVEQGQLLFTIEPEAFDLKRDEAAARLKAGQAELERSRLDLERVEKAILTNAVSQQELTRVRAAYDTAQASVMGFQAAMDKAELELSYTEIHSPIRGRIGQRLVDVGNLVGAGDRTVLATVVQIQPIYVSFNIGENLLKGDILQRLQRRDNTEPLKLQVALPNESDYRDEGILQFLDNRVDPKTGTVYVRGEVANEGQMLLPGMFVRVRVPTGIRKNAVLIPEKAIQADLGGKYVLVVGEKNVLQRRDVLPGAVVGKLRVINEGLDGSETFITGGLTMARPGMPITLATGDQTPKQQEETADFTEDTDLHGKNSKK